MPKFNLAKLDDRLVHPDRHGCKAKIGKASIANGEIFLPQDGADIAAGIQ